MASPTVTTTYSVTVEDINGCTKDTSVTVTVLPLPVVDAGVDQVICVPPAGGSLTLSMTPGLSYVWSTGETTASIIVSPTATTTYTVTGTDTNGCENTDDVVVTVLTPQVGFAQQTPTGPLCQGDVATLMMTPAFVSYLWSTGDTTQTINVQPSTSTTYWVTGTDANGCQASDSVTVTVNPLPVVDAGVDQTICEGQQTQLVATGAITYTWQPGNINGANITISPTSTTTYVVSGLDANGCEGVDSVTITVTPAPTVTASATDFELCAGEASTLTATGAVTYNWSPGGPGASITVTPSATTGYLVTGTDANGCEDTATVVITVHALPTVDAGPDQDLCVPPAGGSLTLSMTPGLSYVWSTGDSTASITVSPASTTTYTVTGMDVNGCTNSDTIIVNVHALPVVDAGPDQNICEGDQITLTAIGATTYMWTPGGNGQSIIVAPTLTTAYIVTGTDTWGCTDEDSITIHVFADPIVNAMPSEICAGEQALLTASGALTYSWQPGGMTGDSVLVTPLATTTYTVTGIDASGCENASTVVVTVMTDCPKAEPILKIPTAFTPNADGLNDIFRIEEWANFTLSSLRIYNRWGEEVFQTSDIHDGWDGSYKGRQQGLGTFVFVVLGEDLQGKSLVLRGNVTVVR
jgi:gliding motility-associated-like protein